jgi:hypothetical protein
VPPSSTALFTTIAGGREQCENKNSEVLCNSKSVGSTKEGSGLIEPCRGGACRVMQCKRHVPAVVFMPSSFCLIHLQRSEDDFAEGC